MIKIVSLKKSDLSVFCRLLLSVLDDGFDYYPENAKKYYKNYWSNKRLVEYLLKKDILMLIAWDGNKAVGYLIGKYYESRKASILWFGVLSTFRGRGIGTKLVNVWELWSRRKGVNILKISTANFENKKFYESLGFQTGKKIVKNDWGMKKLVFIKRISYLSHQKST